MNQPFYIEVNCQQKNHEDERICGDVFLSERVKEENRIVTVLSDGMGHGVKANILATLTATMALNFTREHKDFNTIAEIIMNTLPVCSVRKISYSTFTIVDIEMDGKVSILEYDNPPATIYRDNRNFDPEWQCIILDSEKNKGKELRCCTFYPEKGDRIVFCSDGVVQSGLGSKRYPFGWGNEGLMAFVEETISKMPFISARQLAKKVLNTAIGNDNYHPKDDTSCASIYFREPRKLLIVTGPPYEKNKDIDLAMAVHKFEGKKIVCGATTAEVVARELGLEIRDSFEFLDNDLPPISYINGINLVTEGILTLGKVTEILRNYDSNYSLGHGPADQIVELILQSDEIHIIVGTRINIAHQDPTLPVELEIRRTVVKRIVRLLEEKFLKEVTMEYI
ncbi:MAG TPA: stage II sporulation protein E [Marinilabiliales bacterium]|nr:MAG: stage II sporulation protein E [Bacteroidetes bacterium GWA2_40_14]OFX57726.1 MAG: stage II sporulation protein E [Bacteroidetes bacterium GWC2_40_13]OFX71402.1 MAG: stage II sporulation protein E [Bacteroidetes bacterium GWD2_40_43]OFX91584.1 MAG: stage II sporulation protein E [Bacteroidetes bacterium GWE2_40_63]OFY19518.1 MAG: stage II sporulation protein E [Bacteroidetes bacterium GWF2_40_13]OFZ32234.1 MAG: stage II sporulation protein E [Bacteroidetes bacterium RIFOXYC2_FULL_40_12